MISNSVVLLGDFNPVIFHPDWLSQKVKMDFSTEEPAEVQVIHSEISDFLYADVRFTVERNRFTVRSVAHDFSVLTNIVLQAFTEILSHTPVWAYGVNFEKQVDFRSFENRNRLGWMLAPAQPWGAWGDDFVKPKPELHGGLASIVMKKIHQAEPEWFTNITIQPSNDPEMKDSGVFFMANNHFGTIGEPGKNTEKYRSSLFLHMRENASSYSDQFLSIIDHFEKAVLNDI